jgi:hypothetical protein
MTLCSAIALDACLCAAADLRPLELREDREHPKDGLALRGVRGGLGVIDEPDADLDLMELLEEIKQVTGGSGEAIDFRSKYEAEAMPSSVSHELVEPGSVSICAGHAVDILRVNLIGGARSIAM